MYDGRSVVIQSLNHRVQIRSWPIVNLDIVTELGTTHFLLYLIHFRLNSKVPVRVCGQI